VVLLVALLLAAPRLAVGGLVNAGGLALVRATLVLDEEGAGDESADLLVKAHDRFAWALKLNGDRTATRWGLARASLTSRDLGVQEDTSCAAAADALRPLLAGDIARNSLLYHDALTALNCGDQPGEAIVLYESCPPLERTQLISDAVTLAYLQRGALGDLKHVHAVRPGDLYANYRLWQRARQRGDVEEAAVLGDALMYFPLEAVDPVDEGLLDYVAEVIPSLLEVGLWDRGKALNVVSFLVWRHNRAAGVERLLEDLIARYPADPDWPFYLAELYHRRGDLEQAEARYRQVVKADAAYAQAYLRLGMVSEEANGRDSGSGNQRLSQAARWYAQYNALVPDDLLGLKRLAETCTALEGAGVEDGNCIAAAQRVLRNTKYAICDTSEGLDAACQSESDLEPGVMLRDALATRINCHRIVAEMLDVPVDNVEFGPNLVENGGFEESRERVTGWRWKSWVRGIRGEAAFSGGLDKEYVEEFSPTTLRIQGFWQRVISGKELPRAGYWANQAGEIDLESGALYILTFLYKAGTNVRASVWTEGEGEGFFVGDHFLPSTGGAWKNSIILGGNSEDGDRVAHMRMLLRIWGTGQAEFDDVQVRKVFLSTNPPEEIFSTKFELR
jgi:tetratricopeptide (TPR) repeat protein